MSKHVGTGKCFCGCGQDAPKWRQSYKSLGVQKGDYKRFVSGHQYIRSNKPPATCHPDRPTKVRGLCGSCYNRELSNKSPDTREKILSRKRELWAQRYAARNSEAHAHVQKNRVLKHRYGISLDEYDEKLSAQQNRCAICNSLGGSTRSSRLYVDHNHVTGQVRDFLCPACNKDVGVIEKGPEHLDRLLMYLRKHAGESSVYLNLRITGMEGKENG